MRCISFVVHALQLVLRKVPVQVVCIRVIPPEAVRQRAHVFPVVDPMPPQGDFRASTSHTPEADAEEDAEDAEKNERDQENDAEIRDYHCLKKLAQSINERRAGTVFVASL